MSLAATGLPTRSWWPTRPLRCGSWRRRRRGRSCRCAAPLSSPTLGLRSAEQPPTSPRRRSWRARQLRSSRSARRTWPCERSLRRSAPAWARSSSSGRGSARRWRRTRWQQRTARGRWRRSWWRRGPRWGVRARVRAPSGWLAAGSQQTRGGALFPRWDCPLHACMPSLSNRAATPTPPGVRVREHDGHGRRGD